MTELNYMVVQIDERANPRSETTGAFTGDGVMVARTCDGMYRNLADAEAVAEHFAEKWPQLKTLVVSVVRRVNQ